MASIIKTDGGLGSLAGRAGPRPRRKLDHLSFKSETITRGRTPSPSGVGALSPGSTQDVSFWATSNIEHLHRPSCRLSRSRL
ncbi:hypothetical protein EVAR_58564_1 [Eumeta japonica]|uniref:Uncharacterized protein n=1 Tax=Eumeta variegata TaxID=151549 RepID=A0A4C1YDV6_EUMVA|nr:hypothetical protein EVAR_58564_1 [Eumeta japonica]